MIFGWIRLVFFVLIGSMIAYFLLLIYARSIRREALEKRWAESDRQGSLDAYVKAGMARYEKGLRRRLLWLIFILPLVAISVIFFYSNWGVL